MEPILVITNAEAGTAGDPAFEAGLAILRDHTSVEVCGTSRPDELDGVLHRAGSRWIVVAGGDGSLHAVIAALYRRNELADRVIGLLPMGTGNDFARATGIPLDVTEAAQTLVESEVRPVDLIVDERGGVVVNNVHVGAGAQASRRGARWKDRLGSVGFKGMNLGILGYPIGTVLAAFMPPHVRLRVEVDGEVVNDLDRPTLMVAIGNGTSIGGGTEITPEADPEDGKVDVMISRAVGPVSRFTYVLTLAWLARHHHRDDVSYLRAKSVTVSGDPFFCSADGEISGPERRRSWRVIPGAYRMALP